MTSVVGRGMRPPKGAIGRRLRARRVQLGLSQRELAEPGVSYAYISRIERGQRDPSVKALRRIAPKLGVSAHWLETGEPEPYDLAAVAVRLLISRGQVGPDATTAQATWDAAVVEARELLEWGYERSAPNGDGTPRKPDRPPANPSNLSS